MFEALTNQLNKVFKDLKGRGAISADDIEKAMRQIRIALLEADVALPVAKSLIKDIKEKALGQEVIDSVTPGQMIVKIFHDHLVDFLSSQRQDSINLNVKPPLIIMILGLQGSGKTTTSAKLAHHLINQHKKNVLLCSTDIYRPAAREQLAILAKEINSDCLPIVTDETVPAIVNRAMQHAKSHSHDVIIIDTAGRLQIDTEMMEQLQAIKKQCGAHESFFVADSMTGQSAVDVAKGFNDSVGITGVILTRIDGDARGGAALSMRAATGCDIVFLGAGEKPTDLTPFDAQRMISRIMDMGDVVSLVEQASQAVGEEEAQALQEKMIKGTWNLNDLKTQMQQMQKMGGISSLMGMLPGAAKFKDMMPSEGDRTIDRQIGVINSMTKQERVEPSILNASRKIRIADGAGLQVSDVNRLLKQFAQTQKMMKKLGKIDEKGFKRSKLSSLFG